MATSLDPRIAHLRAAVAAARPAPESLNLYRLDWTVPLDAARRRARAERRPLLVLAVRNGHGDLFTGFC